MQKQAKKATEAPANNRRQTAQKSDNGKGQQLLGYTLPMGKANFIIMGIAALMIVIGFVLISGGATDDGSFNPEVFNSTRLVIGPTMAFIGFIGIGVGIMWNGKKKVTESEK